MNASTLPPTLQHHNNPAQPMRSPATRSDSPLFRRDVLIGSGTALAAAIIYNSSNPTINTCRHLVGEGIFQWANFWTAILGALYVIYSCISYYWQGSSPLPNLSAPGVPATQPITPVGQVPPAPQLPLPATPLHRLPEEQGKDIEKGSTSSFSGNWPDTTLIKVRNIKGNISLPPYIQSFGWRSLEGGTLDLTPYTNLKTIGHIDYFDGKISLPPSVTYLEGKEIYPHFTLEFPYGGNLTTMKMGNFWESFTVPSSVTALSFTGIGSNATLDLSNCSYLNILICPRTIEGTIVLSEMHHQHFRNLFDPATRFIWR